jgi:hypothetical protein
VAQFFERGLDPSVDSFVGRDFTLYDNSHGPEAHQLFFRVLHKAGFFRFQEAREIFANLFPQKVVWSGVGTFTVDKGMASGAVYTTLLNTLLNGLLSTYSLHRAHCGKDAVRCERVSDLVDKYGYSAIFAGDDSATLGRGLVALNVQAVGVLKELGYTVKSQVAPSLFRLGFLGCTPCLCGRVTARGLERAISMVPLPHRFLVTLGWALRAPAKVVDHCGAIGYAWNQALSHVPGYGPLTRAMAVAGGADPNQRLVEQDAGVRLAMRREFSGWSEYSCALGSTGFVQTQETVLSLADSWGVSPEVVLNFDRDLSSVGSFPCYIGTPSVFQVMAGCLDV